MKQQQLSEVSGTRRHVLVFDAGDEVMAPLLRWARDNGVTAASFAGIGAFSRVTVGFFDLDKRDYERIVLDEQVEVLSLAGNIALAEREPKVHAHIVVAKRDGTAHGGHLLEGYVRPTLELVVTEHTATLQRTMDPATGLPLLNPSVS